MQECNHTDVLSSHTTVVNVSYQGIDTIRPNDNGALCGGGIFETKGCATNDCSSSVNNGGSDGVGSVDVTIENVRLNDYYYAEDKAKVGAQIDGNYQCKTNNFTQECCFCKPNGIRSSQVGVWVPQTRNEEGTRGILVRNVFSASTQADGVNLHGRVRDAIVQGVHFANTGDDVYALWGAKLDPENVTFRDAVAVNPGILRPNWYGECVATYGLKSVFFDGITCRAPTLHHPIPDPANGALRMDTSMFVFHTSFDGGYPVGNNVTIRRWKFENLDGSPYTPEQGHVNTSTVGKMTWTKFEDGAASILTPYSFPDKGEKVNVHVIADQAASGASASDTPTNAINHVFLPPSATTPNANTLVI